MSDRITFDWDIPLDADGLIVDEMVEGATMVECEVVAYILPYRPAQVNGDPDDCYEASGGIDSIEVTRKDRTGPKAGVEITDEYLPTLVELAYDEANAQHEEY